MESFTTGSLLFTEMMMKPKNIMDISCRMMEVNMWSQNRNQHQFHKKPTIEELQESKVSRNEFRATKNDSKRSRRCSTSGEIEHFTLSEHDQTSLIGLQTKVLAGEEQIPWHNSDETEHCKFYSNSDMALITNTAMGYVTWHVTYFRDLRIYIRSLRTKDEIAAVSYGMEIPEEYQSEPLIGMMAAKL